jgi:hypothetical protein
MNDLKCQGNSQDGFFTAEIAEHAEIITAEIAEHAEIFNIFAALSTQSGSLSTLWQVVLRIPFVYFFVS